MPTPPGDSTVTPQAASSIVHAFLFVIELTFLKGRERLSGSGAPVEALISY